MIERERLETLAQARKFCPRVNGKYPAPSTLWRWTKFGVNGIKLEHRILGRRICTTAAWLEDFGKALATQRQEGYLATTPTAPDERKRRRKKRASGSDVSRVGVRRINSKSAKRTHAKPPRKPS